MYLPLKFIFKGILLKCHSIVLFALCGSELRSLLFSYAYYDSVTCYGTGDCIITLTSGGHSDNQHKWNTECHDGEALVGILDAGSDYQGFGQVWCRFMFPKKAPAFGVYPYYPWCNVRDITVHEHYCYDRKYPSDTYDTFVTALTSSQFYPGGVSVSNSFKCCRLPDGYHLDYRRCEYKYTHDKFGEHYDGSFWIVQCDRYYLLTGLGQAINPWTNAQHYVWIQCCPLVFNSSFVSPYPKDNRAEVNHKQTNRSKEII
ncbi:uncharacterized protein LOC129592815 isoform X2 [Paramacrobiotus metropolitanus]|uniref:uncharacterized protein LOC129592815 isoform X2 n=1 Tax=Paramacrobiotus metropolitanus TaxID=2943436 RepID=UPI002445D1EF|nr:uncharacterized protein LOC129592815 isoform X2 [Paramacrobiotus metropolitanus]